MTILRIFRPSKVFACLSNFRIYVDDEYSGKISTYDVVDIDVEDGNHSVYIKIGTLKSNSLEFTTKDNELVNLTCGIYVKKLQSILLLVAFFIAYYILLSTHWNAFVKMTLFTLLLLLTTKKKQLFIKFSDDM